MNVGKSHTPGGNSESASNRYSIKQPLNDSKFNMSIINYIIYRTIYKIYFKVNISNLQREG